MRALAFLCLLLCAAFAPLRVGAQDYGDSGDFTITGVTVDVAAPTAIAARTAGWRVAQRKAWPLLYSRLTGTAANLAPRLGDSALDSIVSGIEIEREAIGPKRYIARISVVFDRGRASGYLGASARLLRSAPMLLMPVEIGGGVRNVYERRGVWADAWGRFRIDSSPIAYVRAIGSGGDALVLSGYQAYRPNRDLWRAALARYSAANVLVAEARLVHLWPGGPVTGHFRVLAGPDNREYDRFTLTASSPAELPKMLDIAVARFDLKYTEALRAGELKADQDLLVDLNGDVELPGNIGAVGGSAGAGFGAAEPLNSILVNVATVDEGIAAAFEAAAGSAPGVAGAALAETVPGGISKLRIDYRGTIERLRYNLDQAGLRLEAEGGGFRLRQRLEGEALLPPPVETPPELAPGSGPPAEPAAGRDAPTPESGATAPADGSDAPIGEPDAPPAATRPEDAPGVPLPPQ